MSDAQRPPDPPDPKPDDEDVEEAVEQTFPGSDPPAHGQPGNRRPRVPSGDRLPGAYGRGDAGAARG
jgi:hypothetical protein